MSRPIVRYTLETPLTRVEHSMAAAATMGLPNLARARLADV